MKNILVIVMMFGNVYSQIPFCYYDNNPERWEVIGHLNHTPYGFMTCGTYNDEGPMNTNRAYKSVIRLFDYHCNQLDSIVIHKEGYAINILNVECLGKHIIGLGNIQSLTDLKDINVYIVKLDSSLSIIEELEIDVPYGSEPWNVKAKVQDTANLVMLFSLFPYPAPGTGTLGEVYSLVIKLNANLTDYHFNLIERNSSISYSFELAETMDKSGFFLFSWITLKLNNELEIIDTLNIVELDFFDFGCGLNNLSVKQDDNKTYIVTRTECEGRDVGVNRLDENLKLLNKVQHGTSDWDLAALNRSVDWFDRNYIYSCGYTLPINGISNFFVFCLDSNLNTRWIKHYGGDFNYRTLTLLALPDGSCVIGGDIQKHTTDVDPYIIKIDSVGTLVSVSPPITKGEFWSVKLYPNPVSVYLMMEFENVIGEVLITIVNADGKTVMQEKHNYLNGTIYLNLSELPSGVYLYDVIHQNRRIAQGKIVKE